MRNILPQIAFTVCATFGIAILDNGAVAITTKYSNDEITPFVSNTKAATFEVQMSNQFASSVIRINPVKMQFSNNAMSKICNDISQTIKHDGYGAICIKDTKARDENNTLDVSIANSRLKKFALDTNAHDRNEATDIFKRAIHLGVIKTYNHIRKVLSQMYLDGSQEDKVKYNSFIRLTK